MSLTPERPKLSRPARVLVVDDDAINLTVLSQFCTMFGADVDCASSGLEAIQLCAGAVYDLVLMDIRMPLIDGIEATASIRLLGGAAASVPIIAVTADVGPDLNARCAGVGISVIVQKPLLMQELFAIVQTALDAETPPVAEAPQVAAVPPAADAPLKALVFGKRA